MKKHFLFLLVTVFFLVGCIAAPKIPNTLCNEFDKSKSLLLKISEERNIPLNEFYYGLLDVGQIYTIRPERKQKVAEGMNNLSTWYNKNHPVSYTTLINYMTDSEEAAALAAILARRIKDFKSTRIISKYDDCLLRAGWGNAMDELFLR